MTHAVDLAEDRLGLNDAQLAIAADRVALEPLDVPELIADRAYVAGPANEAGHVRFVSRRGAKIERLTAYRFHRQGILNEHLFHVWPAAGYDWPVLTTVVFEREGAVILGADLIPTPDVVFDRTYYARYDLGAYSALLADYWPKLTPHRLGAEPPPNAYFTKQIGSSLSVLEYLDEGALDIATEFLLDLTRVWVDLHDSAQPVEGPLRARTEERRIALMRQAYKGLDYHSPASDGLASVLGWTGANLMFDGVFGPDDEPQRSDVRRRYLDIDRSPGAPPR